MTVGIQESPYPYDVIVTDSRFNYKNRYTPETTTSVKTRLGVRREE